MGAMSSNVNFLLENWNDKLFFESQIPKSPGKKISPKPNRYFLCKKMGSNKLTIKSDSVKKDDHAYLFDQIPRLDSFNA
jgi:hypothetical protein